MKKDNSLIKVNTEVNADVSKGMRELRKTFPKLSNALDTTLANVVWKVNNLITNSSHEKDKIEETLIDYNEKIESGEECGPLVSIAPEIGVPVIEKLSYINCPEIRKVYIDILYKASYAKYQDRVHPRLVNIVPSLSNQDILLLKSLYRGNLIEVRYRLYESGDKGTFFYNSARDYFPREIEGEGMTPHISIVNLVSLGLLENKNGVNSSLNKECDAYLNEHFDYEEQKFEFVRRYKLKKASNLSDTEGFLIKGFDLNHIRLDINGYELSFLGRLFYEFIESK
ncbi:Abi-alpha family protein [Halobacteriovorax sp. HFRX-2_2]|uniref:Abi-alpha family protein n=1 Tax=unclassified Halobacteriovorax TaxID=2639665 RepID=UPI00371EB04F